MPENIIEISREEDIRIILVQPQFSGNSADMIADTIDAEIIQVNQLQENWLDNIMFLALALAEGLE